MSGFGPIGDIQAETLCEGRSPAGYDGIAGEGSLREPADRWIGVGRRATPGQFLGDDTKYPRAAHCIACNASYLNHKITGMRWGSSAADDLPVKTEETARAG